jgi:hypothetical protein
MTASTDGHRAASPATYSTRAWRDLRKRWAQRLPVTCTRCPSLVQPWDAWDLDHADVPAALGGDLTGARPAHRSCNRVAGGELRQAISHAGKQALSNGGGRGVPPTPPSK